MTYAQNGLIQRNDYNSLRANANIAVPSVNSMWSTGSGSKGYGQSALPEIAANALVSANNWSSLISTTSNIAQHQGTSLASVTTPTVGAVVTYQPNIETNIQNTYGNSLNAALQSTTTANTVTRSTTWNNAITFTHTISFTSGDAARYFFNSGGQIKITASHANSAAGINFLFNRLSASGTGIGTIVLSAPSSGTANIVGTTFNGVTRINGGGNSPSVLEANRGYYGLTTSNTNIFTQSASSGPSGYLNSFIRVIAKTNGTVGANGDNGNVITLYTVWDEMPNGLTVGTGSTTTVTITYPETTYISNTWGAVSVSGAVAGS